MDTQFAQDMEVRQAAIDWLAESYTKLEAAGLLNGQTYQVRLDGAGLGRDCCCCCDSLF